MTSERDRHAARVLSLFRVTRTGGVTIAATAAFYRRNGVMIRIARLFCASEWIESQAIRQRDHVNIAMKHKVRIKAGQNDEDGIYSRGK